MPGWFRFHAIVALSLCVMVAGSCSSDDGGEGATNAEPVVRRAIQALIDGNDEAFLEEVRPDEREEFIPHLDRLSSDVEGCSLDGAESMLEQTVAGPSVTVVFGQSCGDNIQACDTDVEQFTERWYVAIPGVTCY